MKRLLIAISAGLVAAASLEEPVPYKFGQYKGFLPVPDPPENITTIQGAQLGRHLFYDPILSRDSTVSCSSCHQQENAFSSNQKKEGSVGLLSGESREIPPLFNLAWHSSFFWDGRSFSLEEQALFPLRRAHEMNLPWTIASIKIARQEKYRRMFAVAFRGKLIDSLTITMALAQFERTIISANSKYDRALKGEIAFTKDELEGFELVNDMTKGNCLHCHPTDGNALGTTGELVNNGLPVILNIEGEYDTGFGAISQRPTDIGKFKVPSLRNLAFTAPYMHDGRFSTLEEVLDFYSEGLVDSPNTDPRMDDARRGGAHLTASEKKKIIAFLNTMNDTAFVRDARFSNPLRQGLR